MLIDELIIKLTSLFPKTHMEGLKAPSQKTNLLGGVAQILIYARPSLCLADMGLFVRTNFNNPPLEQRVSQ